MFKKTLALFLLSTLFYQCEVEDEFLQSSEFDQVELRSISHDINTRLWPVNTCTKIDGVPEVRRPLIERDLTIGVVDYNEDGILDDLDIQFALDQAHNSFMMRLANGVEKYYTVRLLENSVETYYINKPLEIKTGVVLNGNGKRITPNTDYGQDHLIILKENSNNLGIVNTRILTNYKVKIAGIQVENNVSIAYIYDNQLQDETSDGTERQYKPGAGEGLTTMILINDNVNGIFIDGNWFMHASNGILNNGANVKRLNITHNTFSQWRQRAILIKGKDDGMVENLRIVNNRINEPKLGEVRQPILISGADDITKFHKNVVVNYNSIYSADEPHIWEWNNGVKDSKLTYGTADVISIHQSDDFEIIGNCIFNCGEVGITVATSSKNGNVAFNYIENADTSAIAIGGTLNPENEVQDISVISNTIVNPARSRYEIDQILGTNKYPETNRSNTFGAWAKSAIGYTNSRYIYDNNNIIIETEVVLNPDYDPFSYSNIRSNINVPSFNLAAGYYGRLDSNSTHGSLGELNTANHVVLRDCWECNN